MYKRVSSTNVMDLRGGMMDPNKWKSVAVSIEVYERNSWLTKMKEVSVDS